MTDFDFIKEFQDQFDSIEINPLAITSKSSIYKLSLLRELNNFEDFKERLINNSFQLLKRVNLNEDSLRDLLKDWCKSRFSISKSFATKFNGKSINKNGTIFNEVEIIENREKYLRFIASLYEIANDFNLKSEWLVKYLGCVLLRWIDDENTINQCLSVWFIETYIRNTGFAFQFETWIKPEKKATYKKRAKQKFEEELKVYFKMMTWIYDDLLPGKQVDNLKLREHILWYLYHKYKGMSEDQIADELYNNHKDFMSMENKDTSTIRRKIKEIVELIEDKI